MDQEKDAQSSQSEPKYKCTSCKHIMTASDIKTDVRCTNCRTGRILEKMRTTTKGIEYSAR